MDSERALLRLSVNVGHLFGQSVSVLGNARALHQILLLRLCELAIVVMARLAKVRRAKAEPHGDGAAVATFELDIVLSVLRTVLDEQRRARRTHQLRRIEIRVIAARRQTHGLSAIIRIAAFIARIIRIFLHRKADRIEVKRTADFDDIGVPLQLLILQTHHRLSLHLLEQLIDGRIERTQ